MIRAIKKLFSFAWLSGLFLLLSAAPVLAQPYPNLHRWGQQMQAQPGKERPKLLATTLRYARSATAPEQARMLTNNAGTLGFYHTWLAAHPAERAAFRAGLAQVPGTAAWRQLLRRLTEIPAPGDSLRHGPSPAHNDYLWGSYFASGQTVYLDSLVAQCRYSFARPTSAEQASLFFYTASSAAWSLQANARQDAVVAAYLRRPAVQQQVAELKTHYQTAQRRAGAADSLARSGKPCRPTSSPPAPHP